LGVDFPTVASSKIHKGLKAGTPITRGWHGLAMASSSGNDAA
jgi:hypothetical protein